MLISMLPPDLQHAQIEEYKSTRDRVATIVEAKLALNNLDATECDAVHRSTDHAEAWEDNSEACDVDGGEQQKRFILLEVRRTRPHCSKVRYTRNNQGEREKWRKGRKAGGKGGVATRGKAKESGMDSARSAGRRVTDLVIAGPSRRTRRITGKQTSGRLRKISGDSKSAAISNMFRALNDEDEPNLCPVEKQWTSGRITVGLGRS